MRKDTELYMSAAIAGLGYSLALIEKALLGEKRDQPAGSGPFALALMRVAEIADGAPVVSIELARADMLYLFEMLHYLRGGFWASAWDILKRVHLLVADRISAQEAAAILGESELMLDIHERLGDLHSIDYLAGVWAGYEAKALKTKQDFAKRPITYRQAMSREKEPGADG